MTREVVVPGQRAEQQGPGGGDPAREEVDEHQGNGEPLEDDIEEERIDPRPNTKGPMKTPYELPAFKPDLIRKIRSLGRKIDTTLKRRIADEIRDDMMQYSCYA